MRTQLRYIIGIAAFVIVLSLATGLSAAAAIQKPTQTPTTGQPGASASPSPHTCQIFTVTPGNSAGAPGSVFNSTGQGGQAGLVYAGNPGTASATNANSTAAVSQYDIACR